MGVQWNGRKRIGRHRIEKGKEGIDCERKAMQIRGPEWSGWKWTGPQRTGRGRDSIGRGKHWKGEAGKGTDRIGQAVTVAETRGGEWKAFERLEDHWSGAHVNG